MFSYALRQIQPRSGKPESRASPRKLPSLILRAFFEEEIRGERRFTRLSRESLLRENDPLLSTRAENARPSLTGQERSGPAGRLPLLFFFCSQTARQLVFCLSIFISAVTSVYYCCYCVTYAYACASVIYVSSCRMSLSRCRSNGRVRMA